MRNPFRYRPFQSDTEETFWEDNFVSNFLAYASDHLFPNFCKTPEHWTSRFMHYFYTDCPCCLILRGVIVGMAIAGPLGFIIGWLL